MSFQTVKPGIKTNLVTGFLGAGKTTFILGLLRQKPAQERWAVLVNEFGDIGIDGSILQNSSIDNVFIKEIAGGCICCAMGLPMQIALNQLLAVGRPDRLIIELTGLGHANDLLKTLSQPWYRDLLQLRATIVLMDGRQSAVQRYHTSPLYNAQFTSADIVLVNKSDLCQESDRVFTSDYLKRYANHVTHVHHCKHGSMPAGWLDKPCHYRSLVFAESNDMPDTTMMPPVPADPSIPDCGYLTTTRSADGIHTTGWRFSVDRMFDFNSIYSLLAGMQVWRLKAVVNTNRGRFIFNMVDGCLSSQVSEQACDQESRFEVVDRSVPDTKTLQAQLVSAWVQ